MLVFSTGALLAQPPAPGAVANNASAKPPTAAVTPRDDPRLALDASLKEHAAALGEQSTELTFTVTNVADHPVTIYQVRTSCGCSAAKVPRDPWQLAPGESDAFTIAVDLRGKHGVLHKKAFLDTGPATFKQVDFRVTIPDAASGDDMRQRNLLIAQSDRQAVFKGDCARCHAEPTKGLTGRELYIVACAICHAEEHRASMVPDLLALAPTLTPEHWRSVITHGKPGTVMPAFSEAEDGPLTSAQIDSLVDYLTREFATEKVSAPGAYSAREQD